MPDTYYKPNKMTANITTPHRVLATIEGGEWNYLTLQMKKIRLREEKEFS